MPNVAGRNDLSSSSLVRSIKFMGLVFGKKSDPGNSPHTLPFLGLETYANQLQLFGDITKATAVRKFMNTLPKGHHLL